MEKTAIKNFAIEARKILMRSAEVQAGLYGVTKDGCANPIQKGAGFEVYQTVAGTENRIYGDDISKRRDLVDAVNEIGFAQVMEKAAYTWFNRLIAIRFMEVNDYLPTRTRVLSSATGSKTPDIVMEYREVNLNLTDEDLEKVQMRIKENKYDDAFEYLFVKQCKELKRVLPKLFKKTDDYMELLLKLSYINDGVVRMLVDTIPERNFNVQDEGQVEIIRNKRVLVASQANLAVDNALERLISNPKIRAIRLGSAKKIDSSVSNITEGNVLESFYDSIVQYVDGNFVSKWNQIDARLQGGEVDYHRFQNVDGEVDALKKKIDDRKQKISQIDARGNSNEEFELQNKLRTEKISLIMLQSYCQGNTKDLELMLDKEGIIKIWNVIQPILKSLQNTGLWLTHVDVDVDDLDSAVRINRTNDNLKYIITGARNDITLLDRLKVSSDFGGDTKELEELKIQETLLTEEMMNNPTTEVLEKWRNVKKKIADFNSTGVGLTDAELKQFDMDVLSTMSDDQKRKYIEDVLEKALPFINTLFHRLEEVVQELLKSISDQQVAFEEDRQSQELQKQELSKEIADFQQEIGLKYKIRDAVLHKYKATPDNLLEKIAQVYEQAKRQYRTSIERDDWEEIFRGLENWVQDIPDYQQEKDIYLKDFINGCNVVGVSCTENAKTLTENGFDDFDVVIIDEVSKATPPELLIPMLRGRKIVLVGDHRQLPPLFNEHEKTYLEVAEQQEDMEDVIVPLTMEDFNKYKDMVTASLFERYFENANDSIKETLNYQYRMHTDIMDIINIFYDEYLRDGNEDNYTYDTKAHYLSIPSTSGTEMIIPERHAYWFDSSELAGEKIYEQRRQGSSSAENLVEAEMIMAMLKKMELQYANMKGRETPVSIGVISFYYDQVALIRQMLRQESFYAIDVEVNTVDRFQGKEKEIVFVSLVRNVKNFRHSVDSHIAAFQRINVAFSRAQNLLIIVGAKDMYVDQPVKLTDMNDGTEKTIMAYKQIVEMMDQRGTYFTGDEVITDVRAEEILQELKQRQGGNEV